MTFVLHIPSASVLGDAYLRKDAAPDAPEAWLILPILPKCEGPQGWHYAVPGNVATFPSPCAAKAWIKARKAWQRSRKVQTAAIGIRVLRTDVCRAPSEVW